MNLFINGSNREKNCYNILQDLKTNTDELISLSKKDTKYCLGCDTCQNKLVRYCILDDYITNEIYQKLIDSNKIIIASPIYMSHITGILKNMIDRLNPFYHHGYFNNKEIYLILTGQGSFEENKNEIEEIINYFTGISEWMNFNFNFLAYFTSGTTDNVKIAQQNYYELIQKIKENL